MIEADHRYTAERYYKKAIFGEHRPRLSFLNLNYLQKETLKVFDKKKISLKLWSNP